MKVILMEDVKNHGVKGDVVEVSEGYARNFLFPQHLAVEANEKTVKEKEDRERAVLRRIKKEDEAQKKLAKSIDGREVVLQEKADHGKLYGSIGPKEIVKVLKAMECKVNPDWIDFAPKKEAGEYEAIINFPSGYEAKITIIIEEK